MSGRHQESRTSLWGKKKSFQAVELQEVEKQRAEIGTLLIFNDILRNDTEAALPVQSGTTQTMQPCAYHQRNHSLITGVDEWTKKFKALGFTRMTTTRVGDACKQYHLFGVDQKASTIAIQVTEKGTWQVNGKAAVIKQKTEAATTLAHQVAFWMVAVDEAETERIERQVRRIKEDTTPKQRSLCLRRHEQRACPVRTTINQHLKDQWEMQKSWDEVEAPPEYPRMELIHEQLEFGSHLVSGTSSGKVVEKINKNRSAERTFREDSEPRKGGSGGPQRGGLVTRHINQKRTDGSPRSKPRTRNNTETESQHESPSRSQSLFSEYKKQPSPKKTKQWDEKIQRAKKLVEPGGEYFTELKEAALTWAYNKVYFADHQARTREEHRVTGGLHDLQMTTTTWDLAVDRAKIRDTVSKMVASTDKSELVRLVEANKKLEQKYVTKKRTKTDVVRQLRGKDKVTDAHVEMDAKRDAVALAEYERALTKDLSNQKGRAGQMRLVELDRAIERSLSSLVRAEYDEKDYPEYGADYEEKPSSRRDEADEPDISDEQTLRLRQQYVGKWLMTPPTGGMHQREGGGMDHARGMKTRSMTGTTVELTNPGHTLSGKEAQSLNNNEERSQQNKTSKKRPRDDSTEPDQDQGDDERQRKKSKMQKQKTTSRQDPDSGRRERSRGKETVSPDEQRRKRRRKARRRAKHRARRKRPRHTEKDDSESYMGTSSTLTSSSDSHEYERGRRGHGGEGRRSGRRRRSLSPRRSKSPHTEGGWGRDQRTQRGRQEIHGHGAVPRAGISQSQYAAMYQRPGPVVDVREKPHGDTKVTGQEWQTLEIQPQQWGARAHGNPPRGPTRGMGGRAPHIQPPTRAPKAVPKGHGKGLKWENWWIQPTNQDIDTQRFEDMTPGAIIAQKGEEWAAMSAEIAEVDIRTKTYRLTVLMRGWEKLARDPERDDKMMREEFTVAFEHENKWGMQMLQEVADLIATGVTQKETARRQGGVTTHMTDTSKFLAGPWMKLISWLAEENEEPADEKGRKRVKRQLAFMNGWNLRDMKRLAHPLERMRQVSQAYMKAIGLLNDLREVSRMVTEQIMAKKADDTRAKTVKSSAVGMNEQRRTEELDEP
jgi:hypothetical protein